ncbi:alpha/beta hydrolase [Pelagibacterium lentulum]|uniref:Carboxylesterase n=1 Tax=Pelagibacterium lentulum TaxID=2029865 RepID=A0A916W1I1_9HYPH|nr:alpha/beta hydrolase [Pelagibacterium lentulum]GGA59664.1 carboxylesterase [Pelagibacterium lentulum]
MSFLFRSRFGVVIIIAGVLLAGLGLTAQAFSAVALFGTLVPKDGGVVQDADIAYGPDPRQQLDVYRPQDGDDDLPVVFFAYGGSWAEGEKANYEFVGRAFAARGYVTVIADYRLVPEHIYPDFVDDMRLALEWVGSNIATYGGNPQRVGLIGHSAGAYNVAMVLLADRFRPAPESNLTVRAFAGLAGPYDFYPFDVDATIDAFGQYPEPAETQPVNHIREGLPPVLLVHGDRDGTVLPRNSLALAQGLTAQGNHVEIALYERVDHAGVLIGFARPLRWMNPVYEDVLRFLAQNL